MQTLLTLLLGAVFGALCSYYAKQKGRDGFAWFFIGLFLGLIGLLLLFILPAKKNLVVQEAKEESLPIEIEPYEIKPVTPKKPTLFWYYLDVENKQFGPMSEEALFLAWKEGKINDKTYVWNEEMENWKFYDEIFKASS